MSAIEEGRNSLAGLTLDAILSGEKRPEPQTPPPPPQTPPASAAHASRTLLDIIRDEEPHEGQRDRKSWKTFRDRLRLKRAGAAWTSSLHTPVSDIPVQDNNPRSPYAGRNNHVRFVTPSFNSSDSPESTQYITRHEDFIETVPVSDPPLQISHPIMTRRGSTRFIPTLQPESTQSDESVDIPMPSDAPPSRSFRPQFSRHNSTRYTPPNPADSTQSDDPVQSAREGTRRLAAALAEERALSAREAVAAQEAAEAAAEAETEAAANAARNSEAVAEAQPVRMSLMDLLEETDRQMGVVGSRYVMGDDDEVYDDDEEFDDDVEQESSGGVEHTCCVCMVRHKGAAFIPCGHTFCRLCSRELWVQRGNCPLCNGFILEILDIF